MIYELKFSGAEQDDGRIEILEPSDANKYFSKIPKKETVEQQIARQQEQFKNTNHFSEIIGQWPGEESIEDILKDID